MTTIQVEEYTNEVPVELMQQLAEDGETLLLLESLGLEGQQSLYKSADTSELIKPHPYRKATGEERVVFATCFPNKSEVTKYKQCPIPLRVLQIIEHVKSLKHEEMAYLEVWAPAPGNIDPVLVAKKHAYTEDCFLLARWGTSLAPFSELREKAIEMITVKAKVKLQSMLHQINQALTNVAERVRDKVNDGNGFAPYISID